MGFFKKNFLFFFLQRSVARFFKKKNSTKTLEKKNRTRFRKRKTKEKRVSVFFCCCCCCCFFFLKHFWRRESDIEKVDPIPSAVKESHVSFVLLLFFLFVFLSSFFPISLLLFFSCSGACPIFSHRSFGEISFRFGFHSTFFECDLFLPSFSIELIALHLRGPGFLFYSFLSFLWVFLWVFRFHFDFSFNLNGF